jgi:stage IV sporulation protein FB
VFLAEPPRTQFDLNFQVLGFPVRIHPLFWLVGIILGFDGSSGGITIVIWLFAVFVSILIHELGHALMIRRFGRDAHIVLYAMGGLAIEGRPQGDFGSSWSLESYSPYQSKPRTPYEQILISAAGPGIQLLLAAGVVALLQATGSKVNINLDYILPMPEVHPGGILAEHENLRRLAGAMLYINIFWAFMNLLPILPLDGGQIALQFLVQQDPWAGMQRALWLSVFTGGATAIFALLVLQQPIVMMMFASLAVSSYLTLQQSGGHRPW